LQAQRGQYADALDSFLHALTKPEALNRVGEAALARKDYSVARDYLQRAAEASPVWFERAHVNLQVAEAHLALSGPGR
jgi:tetratricopeptide (TPR) repeat protein